MGFVLLYSVSQVGKHGIDTDHSSKINDGLIYKGRPSFSFANETNYMDQVITQVTLLRYNANLKIKKKIVYPIFRAADKILEGSL